MPKKPEINPHQGELFAQTSSEAINPIPSFPEDPKDKLLGQPEIPVSYGPIGSFIDLSDRANLLLGALSALGKSNQRGGFDTASNTRQHSGPIWGRYRSGTPRVQEGAERNRQAFQEEAKKKFWQATGYIGLRAAKTVPPNEIDAGGRLLWRKFNATYAGTGESTVRRDKFKRRLSKSLKVSQEILKDRAA